MGMMGGRGGIGLAMVEGRGDQREGEPGMGKYPGEARC